MLLGVLDRRVPTVHGHRWLVGHDGSPLARFFHRLFDQFDHQGTLHGVAEAADERLDCRNLTSYISSKSVFF